jgi:pimeloyl-ACP methyl ester carboxylesterase
MITYKIRYKGYLVNVYVPEKRSGKSVLLLPGLPMSMNVNNILTPFLEAGAVVFYPYYSGSYDSAGSFSARQSIQDVAELYPLTQIKNVTELYFGEQIEVGPANEVVLAGMSYGAVAALLGHQNLYQKIIFLSPAFLFNSGDIGGEVGKGFHGQMKNLLHLLKNAHPFTYRLGFFGDLEKFLLGQSRMAQREAIEQALHKINCASLIMHGENDTSVPIEIIHSLEERVPNKQISWHYSESAHSTSSYDNANLELIKKFVEA